MSDHVRDIDPSELKPSPCPMNMPHSAHIWALDRTILTDRDLERNRDFIRVVDNLRVCAGVERVRTDEEKWTAAKRAMLVISFFMALAFSLVGLLLILFSVML